MKSTSITKPLAVVFGMGPAGLFLSRQLGKNGYSVIAIGKKDDIGQYSNSLTSFFASEDINIIYNYLARKLDGQSAKAYICSDQYLTLILEECKDMFDLLKFEDPTPEQLQLIADKQKLMDFAIHHGVRFPEQYHIKERNDFTNLKYPVAIKPNIKRGYSPLKKITIIQNIQEMLIFWEHCSAIGIKPTQLIIQQYIAGNNMFEFGYGGYFKNGVPVCDVCFHQLRQYPQGVCCHILEVTDQTKAKNIKQQPRAFIKSINYNGFIQFDIKENAYTGEFYTLDINPRPWGSVSLLINRCKTNNIFEGNEDETTHVPIGWRFPLKEIMSLTNKNNVSYREIRELRTKANYKYMFDLYDSKDKKPFLMQPLITLRKIFK